MTDKSADAHEYPKNSLPELLKLLEPTQPYCLPLFRRIQLALKADDPSKVFATFSSQCSTLPQHFAVGLLHHESPGVQAFLFSSLELQHGENASLATKDTQCYSICLDHLETILRCFRASLTKTLDSDHMDRAVIIVGSVRMCTANMLRSIANLVRDDIAGPGGPYGKYLFRVSDLESENASLLPKGLYLDENILPSDYELIISTNDIISNVSSLLQLPYGVGLRSQKTDGLVAWAYLGIDGCVRTLYVVPECRCLGLGRIVARQAAIAGAKVFDHDLYSTRDKFGFGDVSSANVGSIKLFESLGAQWVWNSYWMRIDLRHVPFDSA